MAMQLLRTGEICLAILDSVGVLYSGAEGEKGMNGETMGGIAKPLTKFVKFITQICNRYNTTFIAINQIRDNVGGYGQPTSTVGGRAFKHACSIRLALKRFEYFDENYKVLKTNAESPYGHTIKVKLDKTKVTPPNRKLGQYTLVYTKGIDVIKDTITVAKEFEIVKQAGAWFEITDIESGEILPNTKVQGEPALRKLLVADKDLYERIKKQIDKQMMVIEYKEDEFLSQEDF